MLIEEVRMARTARLFPFFLSVALGVISTAPAYADTTLFSEDFSGAIPAANYGVGTIGGTQITVTANAVDILGVLNGTFAGCANNAGGNCLDLVGSPGEGAIASVPTFHLIAGDTYTITFGYILQGFPSTDTTDTSQFSVGLGSFSTTLTAIPTVQQASLSFMPLADQTGVALTMATLTEPDLFHGAVIDHIVLTEEGPVSAVPEPSSLVLLAGPLAMLLRARRRG
jgi:hypothetical protein